MSKMNMFYLSPCVSHHLRTHYRATILLRYQQDGKWRSVSIAHAPLHRSKERASRDIPRILLDPMEYEDVVGRAIKRVQDLPTEVFKVFALSREGELRSLYVEQVPYRLGAIHAHPIIPTFHVGLFVHRDFDVALAYAKVMLREFGSLAVVRCAASEVVEMDGTFVTSALIPLRIERILLLSPIRIALSDGMVEEWDEGKMRWKRANRMGDFDPGLTYRVKSHLYVFGM